MRTTMAIVGMHKKLRSGIWYEYTANITKIENIMVRPQKEKYAYKRFYGEITDLKNTQERFGKWALYVV